MVRAGVAARVVTHGLVLIPRDDWRLAYVSVGVDGIHGEMSDSRPADEKLGQPGDLGVPS
jgi:hypothetical protein